MTRLAAVPSTRMVLALVGSLTLAIHGAPSAAAQDRAADTDAGRAADNPAATDSAATANAAISSLAVTPLRVELGSSATAETVQVQNSTGTPMAVQIRLFAWSQQAGEDVYAPSSDLIVSPSIVSIPAGQTQLVRVLRKGQGATPGEKRFRLVVDQLPDPAKARPGVAQTRVRFAIPVFVDRDKAAPAVFAWRVTNGNLELANNGGATARVVQIALKRGDGRVVPVEQNALRYVMGASTISWPILGGCAPGKVFVTAEIDGRTVDAEPVAACG